MAHPTMRNPAYARYIRRLMPIAIFYVAGIMLATFLVDRDAPLGPLAVGLALLPGLAMVAMIWSMGRFLTELDDEYLRMLEVRKFIIATGVTLVLTSMWGILELFVAQLPHLPVFYVFPLWCAGLFVGQIANRISFGDGGPCP